MFSFERKTIERSMWLRFIPFKLHYVVGALGAAIAVNVFGDAEGLSGFFGFVAGLFLGLPLQYLKAECVETASKSRAVTRDTDPILDLDRGRNIQQLITGLVCAAIGCVVGYVLPDEGRLIGASLGAVLGFIAGVFASGLFLLLSGFLDERRTPTPSSKSAGDARPRSFR